MHHNFSAGRGQQNLLPLAPFLIITDIVLSRLHVKSLRGGSSLLDKSEAHHARDVLRLVSGDGVELFDDSGATARGTIETCDRKSVMVRIDHITRNSTPQTHITLAAAVPKGERADWMIEKLSELGVDRFIPLQAARSVVVPAGRNKLQRWNRIAIESAKQSRRIGIMRIDEVTSLSELLGESSDWRGTYLSTEPAAQPLGHLLQSEIGNWKSEILLLIGPEGGWTADEIQQMNKTGLTAARLTGTILRVETAAVAAAAIACTWRTS